MKAWKKLLRSPNSIRRRLFWLMGGVGLGALLIVNLIWLPWSIREVRHSQAELQLVAVRGGRDKIQLFLDESIHALKHQATLFRTPFVEGTQKGLDELARNFLRRELPFEEIGITDRLGKEILRHSRRLVITDRDLRDLWASSFFQEGMRSESYWGPVALTETSEPWVTLAVPLKQSDSVTVGVVFGVLNLRSLWSLTSQFKLSRGGRIYLVDQEGRLIAADDAGLVRKRLRFADRPMVGRLLDPGNSNAASFVTGSYTNEYGEEVTATGLPLPGPRWSIIVEQPKSALYVPIKQKLWFSLGTSLIGLLLCFILAYFLSERFTGPITRLREGVEKIAQGNLDQRVAVETGDEIEALADQFNEMARALNESYQRLEERIAERSSDLSALYSALTPLARSGADPLLQRVVERLKEATHADAALIRIFDSESAAFTYPANVGFPASYLEATRSLDRNSAIGIAFTTGKPIIARDIAQDARLKGKKQLEAGFKSCAFLPLRASGELRGVVHLASRKLGHFNEEKTDHLMTIARQMGVALENQELFYKVERSAKEQQAINKIAQAISQSLRRDELLEIALDKVLEITGRERGTIRLKDPVTGEVALSAHRGFSEEEIAELLRNVPHRISEQIFASGQPLVVNDRAELHNDQSLLPQSRSVTWIPIKARQKVVGVLGVSAGKPIPFSQREVDLLQAIGNVIGVAIENAWLFEESQRQEEIQRLLKELSQDITTLDIDALFHKVADKVREFFKVDVADIRLLEEHRLQPPVSSSGIEANRLYKSGDLRGRAQWILKNRRPLVIADTTKETEIPTGDSIRQVGIRGYLAVPLFSRNGEVIGILRALTREPREFSQSEVDLLQQLANGTAIAVANARLFEETGRRARELAALHAVTAAVSGSFDLDQILLKGLDAVLEVTEMEVGYIQFLEGDPPRLLLKAHRGMSELFLTKFQGRVRPGGKTEQIIATRQPVVMENIPGDHVGKFQGERVTAAAWVPITSKDEVIGVLTISSKTRPTFPLSHLPLLASIGNTLGAALENARLFEETKQRAHEQAVLSAVAMAMSESLQLDELLRIALDRLLEVTGREQGYIRLKDPVTGNLTLAAHRGVSERFLQTLLHERTPGGKSDQVFKSGEVLVINDPEGFQLKEQTRREGNRSLVWVPLKVGGKTVGIVNVATSRSLPFQPREVELLKAIGNVIGVALENARLFNETERSLERIRALREIDQAITTSLDLRTILDVLMEKIDLVLPYSAATVRLFNRATGFLEPVACRNLDENEWKQAQWRGGRGIANVVFEKRAPLIIRNAQADARVLDAAFYRKHSLTSYVGVPLRVKDEVLGVLGFYTKEEHEFTGEEVEFLMTLAGQAAIAIHKSQLYEEARAREKEMQETNRMLSALHAVAAAASQSLDLDRVVRAAIEKITEIFAFDATQIHVYDERADELAMRAYFERDPKLFASVRAFKVGEGIVGKVAESGKSLIFEDLLTDPLYQRLSRSKVSGRFGYHFFAVFPIKGKLKSLGTLACTGIDTRHLNAGEVQLLEAMADQIAVAIENTGLYEQLTQKVDELQFKTEELQRANKVKDEFLSVMSHELRTPLNVVMGYTAMIKDQMVGAVNPEQSQILEKLMSRVRAQLNMVNSMLQATQIQAATVALEREEVKLKDLLDGIQSEQSAGLTKPLTLLWDYPPDLPAIRSDGRKLKQILENLIHNAIKFTDWGGVTVSARVMGDGDQGSGIGSDPRPPNPGPRFIEFRVTDTGRGIPAAALPIIFEKFRQADSSETRPYGGVGLGLYIAKNFAEILGGRIEVESGEGKGSVFTVIIPCVESALTAAGQEQDSPPEARGNGVDAPPAPIRVGKY